MTFDERARQIEQLNSKLSVGCAAPFLLTSIPGAIFWGLDAAHRGWPLWPTLLMAALALVGGYFVFSAVRGVAGGLRVRVIPFFSARIDLDFDHFHAGEAIASTFDALEASAQEAGLPPLSHFAAPTWYGAPPRWSAPADALPTVRHLRGRFSSPARLSSDLELLEAALTHADAAGAGFCFHLRSQDPLISPAEMDQLNGSYW